MRMVEDSKKLIETMQLFDKNTGEYIPFKLWQRQSELLELIHSEKKIILLKKRQVAGSQLTGADSLAQCMLLDNFLVLVLSKTGDDAKEYLRRVSGMYYALPKSVRLASPLIAEEHPMEKMEFKNGSRILSLSARKGAGYTADRVIIDEAAKINTKTSHITLDEVLKNVEPALEKAGGQLILVSTAEGYGQFQQLYAKGKTGETSWRSFFFSCWDDPTFIKEKRDQLVIDHGEDHVNENYPRTDIEAFLVSGNCRFNITCLKSMQEISMKEGERCYLSKVKKSIICQRDPKGIVRIFKHPQRGEIFTSGFDIAEGLETGDYSTGQILNAKTLEQVAELRCHYEPNVFAEEISRLCTYYHSCMAGIERNNHGIAVLQELKKIYFNLYYMESFAENTQVRKRKLGWITSSKTKPLMVAEGDKMIREAEALVHSPDLISELMTFIRFADGTTGAQDGSHDDLVIAWLIALQVRKYVHAEEPTREEMHKELKADREFEKQIEGVRGY